MLISKKWLSQYIDIDAYTMDEIADKITSAGFEVEGIIRGSQASNLVIGYVEECVAHPDSDHLHVCKVNDGKGIRQIVCGAPNVGVSQKVIVALPGAKLPEVNIEAGVIRGVESNGMICGLLELGVDPKSLNEDQKRGIEILSEDAIIGNSDVLAYLGIDDTILDVGLTPNRNDCMSAFAMAKECGAILNEKVQLPSFEGASKQGAKTSLKITSMSEKCPLYTGKIVRDIVIKESPNWMKQLLMAANIKSINNVVDISNLVMLETGQPLHFFDLAKLEKEEIMVRDDISGSYIALDEETYKIENGDIMICVNDQPVAIAGIMGGADSKIDENTKGILIEAASFNTVSIRNTSRRLNLNTDASIRYQKGIEPNAPFMAMDRAISLLIEYADAKGIEATVNSCEMDIKKNEIDVNLNRINTLLGTDFEEKEVMDVLKRLDLTPINNGKDIHVIIPTYRQDLCIEVDIAEEIIRILGYDRLASTLPVMPATVGALTPRQQMRRKVREVMTCLGYYEAQSYTLVSDKLLKDAIMPFENHVELASPMSEDRKIIRTSILPSLLGCVAYNAARSMKDIALFEVSNVYSKEKVEERFAICLSGTLQKSRWQKWEVAADFYTIKGMVMSLLENLGYGSNRVLFKENDVDTIHFHPYQSACVYLGRDLLGIVGSIHPQMSKEYDVPTCVMAELNMEVLINNKAAKVKFDEISKFPQVSRDLAFVVEEKVKVADIIKAIKKNGKAVIKAVEVFDVYMGEHVEKGYKSIALSITFQAQDRTLKEDEISEVHNKILETLKKELNALLRT